MANVNKEQAIIDFLLTCDAVKNSPLYFNFINAKDNNRQIITLANEKNLNRPYVDGSVLRRYTFTIVDFKSVTYNAIVTQPGYSNENVEDYVDVQAVIDWVTEQAEDRNYPAFGDSCIIDDMRVLTDNPNLNGVDTNVKPALAKYSFSVQIDYLDRSKVLWNK